MARVKEVIYKLIVDTGMGSEVILSKHHSDKKFEDVGFINHTSGLSLTSFNDLPGPVKQDCHRVANGCLNSMLAIHRPRKRKKPVNKGQLRLF